MVRKIITIDEEKCTGCGLCAEACQEGAIGMVKGKAKLLREDYCDGLGNCLPACPAQAIRIEEREAAEFSEAAAEKKKADHQMEAPCRTCPGTASSAIRREAVRYEESIPQSQLSQWPVQIKLAPIRAPYFEDANLLIAADCTAYAYGDFHNRFIRNRVTLIGCPKLDEGDYSAKLTEILKNNRIKSVTIVKMEVPCCGGMERAVRNALQNSGKFLPWQVVTISTDGKILE